MESSAVLNFKVSAPIVIVLSVLTAIISPLPNAAALPTDATLSALSISQGTLAPTFDLEILDYTASVANAVSSMSVTPTSDDLLSTIAVNGVSVASGSPSEPIALAVGSNRIDVLVTAGDGITTNTYTVTVTRSGLPTDALLAALSISQGTLAPAFDSGILTYTASVANAVSSMSVTPTRSQANATIQVRVNSGPYAPVASGSASGSLALNVGSNTIDVLVTAGDGVTTRTYTVTVTRNALSTDATLAALSISQGTLAPAFDSGILTYTASVANAVSSMSVTPTSDDLLSTIAVNGVSVASGSPSEPIALAVGSNLITIVVTAQDGVTTRTYTVTVTRSGLPTDALLAALSISQGTLAPAFDSGILTYTASVANAVSSMSVTPTRSQANATIQVRVNSGPYAPVASGSASGSLVLNVGSNTIDVLVTAGDGTTTNTYTVTVTRNALSTGTLLFSLSISQGTLAPAFDSEILTYTASVANAVSSMSITPTRNQANATIQVRVNSGPYAPVASGSASGSLALNVGSNRIDVLVTAQDGVTTRTYTVTVTRSGLSTGALLSALATSVGTLAPTFTPGIFTYTASVANAVSSMSVTPTRSQANATI